jgi:hypothetical protein
MVCVSFALDSYSNTYFWNGTRNTYFWKGTRNSYFWNGTLRHLSYLLTIHIVTLLTGNSTADAHKQLFKKLLTYLRSELRKKEMQTTDALHHFNNTKRNVTLRPVRVTFIPPRLS